MAKHIEKYQWRSVDTKVPKATLEPVRLGWAYLEQLRAQKDTSEQE